MSCPSRDVCALTPVLIGKPSLRVLHARYCEDAHESCARFRAARLGMRFAPNLLPDGRQLHVRDLVRRDELPDGAARSAASRRRRAAGGE